ncbi:SAM-dependent methyltransferase [Chryseolinea sp. T2]|uniref:THUMP-like domain-containing protein n=1 Tax=Chryseolinea sp. T2 TaxID=3129255 RepID=UPI00307785F3
MIDPAALSPEVRQFVMANEHADVPSLLLKYKSIDNVPISAIADQIIGRRKAKSKLPTYYSNEDILYPPVLNLEQTSSEKTAQFKASLIRSYLSSEIFPPDTLVDLTGGFGIDSFAFSKFFKSVVHVEPDERLQRLAQHNHLLLGSDNIVYATHTAEEFLKTMVDVSAVYIDPSRRSGSRKVYSLHDCQPDITELQDQILRHSRILMTKASPMLDIQLALGELRQVKKVFVVAVDNEVRELLFIAECGFSGEARVVAINESDGSLSSLEFSISEEQFAVATVSDVMDYLYEPNAALLKAGAFKLPSVRYNLNKLHVNTHLYTGDTLKESFPGRIFRVVSTLKADSRKLHDHFPEGKANIITRNYPSTPEALKKKLKLGDGGDRYLLAFTSTKGPELAAVERLK